MSERYDDHVVRRLIHERIEAAREKALAELTRWYWDEVMRGSEMNETQTARDRRANQRLM